MFRILAAALAASGLALPAAAEIYQWKDADGKVHFTDKPPADRQSQTVNIRSQPAAGDDRKPENRESAVERQKKMLKVLEEDRAARNAAQAKRDEEARQVQDNCNRLRDQQQQHARGGRFYTLEPGGERRYKTDEEITRDRENIEQALKNCR